MDKQVSHDVETADITTESPALSFQPVERTEQEMVFDNMNRLHELVGLINQRQTHIVFYEISAHIDHLEISIRHKDDYQVVIMRMDTHYRTRKNHNGTDDQVFNNNILNKMDAMGQVLLKLIHNPEITTMKEIIANHDDIVDVLDDDLPF